MLDGQVLAEAQAGLPRPDLSNFRGGAVGFALKLPKQLPDPTRLRALEVRVFLGDSDLGALPPGATFLADLRRHAACSEMAAVLASGDLAARMEAARLLQAELRRAGVPGDAGAALSTAMANFVLAQRTLNAEQGRPETVELSQVLLPFGVMSGDGSAVLGRNGQLFLVQGSNHLLSLYNGDLLEAKARAAKWLSLFRQRLAAARAAGAAFVQIVLPEKLSLLPDAFPEPLAVPTPLLGQIEAAVAEDSELSLNYVSGLDVLRSGPTETYLRSTDTHYTPAGNFALLSSLADRLGLVSPAPRSFTRPRLVNGDLGLRFFGLPLMDRVLDAAALPDFVRGAELVDREVPANGEHQGLREVWRNLRAPYDMRVVAFANSFFGPSTEQTTISWWMARWFREYHFVWSAAYDPDYVGRVRPDAVICQTIERFLGFLPAA